MTESHFKPFRANIIGINHSFETPFGNKKLLYADWIASGRLYQEIEDTMLHKVSPFCANTHTETSHTGTLMTNAYHEAKEYIKKEVGANENDILIFSGSGMTDSINKLQRILGLRIPDSFSNFGSYTLKEPQRPIVFVTHLEHHSNHTSWLETIADVEIINPTKEGEVDLLHLEELVQTYKDRPLKIASISAASNVTGILTPYYAVAEMMHRKGGICLVDFACSGPYVDINMHPENDLQYLDAIFISPHKFLGGPGTPGIMVVNKNLIQNTIPDNSGGGTVKFTTPWKTHEYLENIEEREDGGTPPFLQGIRAALCFKLKKEMGVKNILAREEQIINKLFDALRPIENLHILQDNIRHRVGAISFYIDNLHFNLGVKLLNDYFGIQVRGGCACAGTYGHYLLNIDREQSSYILSKINEGELIARPGWIRLSVHPTYTDEEVQYIIESITFLAQHHEEMGANYEYIKSKNIFLHKSYQDTSSEKFLNEVYG